MSMDFLANKTQSKVDFSTWFWSIATTLKVGREFDEDCHTPDKWWKELLPAYAMKLNRDNEKRSNTARKLV